MNGIEQKIKFLSPIVFRGDADLHTAKAICFSDFK